MIFRATNTQVLQVIVNAINASSPMGIGLLLHQDKDYTVEEFLSAFNPEYKNCEHYVDYFQGRMVKFGINLKERINDDEAFWEVRDDLPRLDYQSWCGKYHTYKALVESVEGVTVVDHA